MTEISKQVTASCIYVSKSGDQSVARELRTIDLDHLPDDFVRVKVEFSSLNYKDALCATGHPGVAKTLPIIPGIDAAGRVVESNSELFKPADKVMVFNADFGTAFNGGYCEIIDVPADWVYMLPQPLTARETMILGTAGFTAAQCIDQLQAHNVLPAAGEIIVTGATGGVGACAVMLLAKLGYDVVAATGKKEKSQRLKSLGANSIIGRDEINDKSDRPLLKGRWAGAVDTVGGNILASILRSTMPYGCVTACGLVGGVDFNISVYPFILRGITLQGIDSAGISREHRKSIWHRLATDWSINDLEEIAVETDLAGLDQKISDILAGQISGRVLVKVSDSKN